MEIIRVARLLTFAAICLLSPRLDAEPKASNNRDNPAFVGYNEGKSDFFSRNDASDGGRRFLGLHLGKSGGGKEHVAWSDPLRNASINGGAHQSHHSGGGGHRR